MCMGIGLLSRVTEGKGPLVSWSLGLQTPSFCAISGMMWSFCVPQGRLPRAICIICSIWTPTGAFSVQASSIKTMSTSGRPLAWLEMEQMKLPPAALPMSLPWAIVLVWGEEDRALTLIFRTSNIHCLSQPNVEDASVVAKVGCRMFYSRPSNHPVILISRAVVAWFRPKFSEWRRTWKVKVTPRRSRTPCPSSSTRSIGNWSTNSRSKEWMRSLDSSSRCRWGIEPSLAQLPLQLATWRHYLRPVSPNWFAPRPFPTTRTTSNDARKGWTWR